jgi:CRISPR-associated endonuclease/helicase Cas3
MYYAHSTDRKDRSDWQRLADHLDAVAELVALRAARFGLADAGHVAGLLHDLGKYSDPFQRRLAGSHERVDHSTAGAIVARERFPGGIGELLSYAIAGHHAGLANGRDAGSRTPLTERLAADLPELSPIWQQELQLPEGLRPPREFKPRQDRDFFQLAFLARMLFSCLVDADFIETEAFYTRADHGKPPARGGRSNLNVLRGALNAHL